MSVETEAEHESKVEEMVLVSFSNEKRAIDNCESTFSSHTTKKSKIEEIEAMEVEVCPIIASTGLRYQYTDEKNADRAEDAATPTILELAERIRIVVNENYEAPSSQPQLNGLADELSSLPVTQLPLLWKTLRGMKFSDPAVLSLTSICLTETTPQRQATGFFQEFVLPVVCGLNHAASRVLFSSLLSAAKLQPRAALFAFLCPLFSDPTIGSAQAEIITRLLRECMPSSLQNQFVREVCSKRSASVWTDFQMDILSKTLSGTSEPIDNETWAVLVERLEEYAPSLSSSLKFANILFQLVQKHLSANVSHAPELRNLLSSCNSYLAKAAATKLQSIVK